MASEVVIVASRSMRTGYWGSRMPSFGRIRRETRAWQPPKANAATSTASTRTNAMNDFTPARLAHKFERAQQPAHFRDANVGDPPVRGCVERTELIGSQQAFIQNDLSVDCAGNAMHALMISGLQGLFQGEKREFERSKRPDGDAR